MLTDKNQDTASGALRAFGWHPESDTSQLRIDGVGASGYQVGRAWSPDGVYRTVPDELSMYVTMSIEGDAIVTHDGEEHLVRANQMMILDGAAESQIQLRSPVARYLWRFGASNVPHRHVRGRVGEPLDIPPEAWAPVAALTNSLVDAPPTLAESVHALRASEYLLTMLLEKGAGGSAERSRLPDLVYSDAMRVIAERRHDPAFTAAQVAPAVLVSERSVRRAFARMNTTVHKEIEWQRVEALRESLPKDVVTPAAFAERAEAAGFTSARRARDALRRCAPRA